MVDNPTVNSRVIAAQDEVSNSYVWKTILQESYFPYFYQRVQELHPEDHPRRVTFVSGFWSSLIEIEILRNESATIIRKYADNVRSVMWFIYDGDASHFRRVAQWFYNLVCRLRDFTPFAFFYAAI